MLVLLLPRSDYAAELPPRGRRGYVFVLAGRFDWCLCPCPRQPYPDLLLQE